MPTLNLEMKYKDIIFFKQLNIGFVYSYESESILRFDRKYKFSFWLKRWISGFFGRIFRKEEQSGVLFVNTFFDEIEIFHNIGKNEEKHSVKLTDIPGRGIVDYQPFCGSKILVLTSDGLILIYEHSEKGCTLLNKTEEDFMGYFGIAVSICSKEKYVAVASQKDLHIGILSMYEFSDESTSIKKLSSLDMRRNNDESENEFLYYLKELNMEYYLGDYPIILGFQYHSDFVMIPFLYNGEEITILNDPQPMKRDKCCRVTVYKEDIWLVDYQGKIVKLSLINSQDIDTQRTKQFGRKTIIN